MIQAHSGSPQKKRLQATCQNNGIPVEEEICHVIEGWEGNQNGYSKSN
jgi:hypothetical protein